jgi:hypothetical protein
MIYNTILMCLWMFIGLAPVTKNILFCFPKFQVRTASFSMEVYLTQYQSSKLEERILS